MSRGEKQDEASQDQFLLAQFTMLGNHIANLHNVGTQRISAFLVFVGLTITGMGIVSQRGESLESRMLIFSGAAAILLVGYLIWERTVYLLIQITRYFRIMNGTRGYFAEKGSDVARVSTDYLPRSGQVPRWNRPVFDPGLLIIELILAVVVGLFAFFGFQVISPVAWTELKVGAAFIAALATLFVLRQRRQMLLRNALMKERVEEVDS